MTDLATVQRPGDPLAQLLHTYLDGRRSPNTADTWENHPVTTPAQPADLITWLHQQFENQRFRGESLKTLAFALPPETGAYLTETGELLLADVDARRRILDRCVHYLTYEDYGGPLAEEVLRLLALPYAHRPGYREDWRPE